MAKILDAQPAATEVSWVCVAAYWVNGFVFVFFTGLLLCLQFGEYGASAYFSEYVEDYWHGCGYLLYGAVLYLFAIYVLVLLQARRYLTALLQLFALALVIGIMRSRYTSVDHVSLLPFLAAVQPIILYVDRNFTSWDDFENVRRIAVGIMILLLATPATFLLMASPKVEKILIYLVVALLFLFLQQRLKPRRVKS